MSTLPRQELPLSNEALAGRLEEIAERLEATGANPFRVRAYRVAATTVRGLAEPVAVLIDRAERGDEERLSGLIELPGIGAALAHTMDELVHTGSAPVLERLRGETDATRLFATVPGLGQELAGRIHEQLGVESLGELELAAHDGRLATVRGLGPRRLRAVQESLAGRFRRGSRPPRAGPREAPGAPEPDVAELLDVDREYREAARQGRLPRLTPRRFNPTGEAWLPVLHTERGNNHYTALYSNSARAHELGALRDWVVLYREGQAQAAAESPAHARSQWTVLTAHLGALRGRRIVAGREPECAAYYRAHDGGDTQAS